MNKKKCFALAFTMPAIFQLLGLKSTEESAIAARLSFLCSAGCEGHPMWFKLLTSCLTSCANVCAHRRETLREHIERLEAKPTGHDGRLGRRSAETAPLSQLVKKARKDGRKRAKAGRKAAKAAAREAERHQEEQHEQQEQEQEHEQEQELGLEQQQQHQQQHDT